MIELVSIFLGSIFGYLYGLSLIYQREKAPSIFSSLYGILRIVVTLIIFYYLLRSDVIHFILLLISFIVMLWVTILTYKE